jgi:hypothetical protein
MASETRNDVPEHETGAGRTRPRRFRPSQVTILVTVGALGLNLAALAIVVSSVATTREEVVQHLTTSRPEPVEKPAPAPLPTEGGRVDELLAIADQLEQTGEVESARQVRAAARRLLVARSEENGAFDYAVRLLESGHPREARRALYRVLARADQPGTRWGELSARARFLIGETLAREADGRQMETEVGR